MVAIHPIFNKLIVALRTAVESGEGSLDKEATSHYDLTHLGITTVLALKSGLISIGKGCQFSFLIKKMFETYY
jgi:hypothetical protein